MSKRSDEIASDIVQALIQARGAAIAPTTNSRGDLINTFLSDEAIAAAYTTILKAVNNS